MWARGNYYFTKYKILFKNKKAASSCNDTPIYKEFLHAFKRCIKDPLVAKQWLPRQH
jgi:hypothetical protein